MERPGEDTMPLRNWLRTRNRLSQKPDPGSHKSCNRLHPTVATDRSLCLGRKGTVSAPQSVEVQYRLTRWDGTYRWMQVHAVPLRDSDGSIVRWLGMNIDFDDRKRTGL